MLGRGSGPTWNEAKQEVSEYLTSFLVGFSPLQCFIHECLIIAFNKKVSYGLCSSHPFCYVESLWCMLNRQRKKLMSKWNLHYDHISEGMGQGTECFFFPVLFFPNRQCNDSW